MTLRSFLALVTFSWLPYTGLAAGGDDWDPLKYVNPLIGSANGGNVFSGASIPYGVAKPVADTDDQSNQGGFVYGQGINVTGFSQYHDSGTGGAPSLGNFALFPYASCPNDDLNQCIFPKKRRKIPYVLDSVASEPGYFSITLTNNVTVDMTSTHHTSLFRFEFPPSGSPLILLDLTDLSDSRQDNGTIDVVNNRMLGGARFTPSFAQGSYQAYFCAEFQGADIRDNGIFVNNRASADVKSLKISRSINGYPLPGGGFIRFSQSASEVYARVGLSFISPERACWNAEKEIPNFEFDSANKFDAVKAATKSLWREKLSPIRINPEGVNSSIVTIFYSGIYRTMINPQDYTGENPLWKSSEPYFDSFYCLWDSFRSQLPFLMLLDPQQTSRMIRSLIDTYVHDGWLPECRMSFSRGYTQGGSNADIVLADALLKGLKGIDWDLGYKAVVNDAENEPYDWCCRGRGGLDSWKSLGYVPVEDFDFRGFGTMTRSISRTLEYSYNDFVIAEMAQRLGFDSDAQKYLERSQNWKNLFNSDVQSLGYNGFFQPRYLNKTWGYQDPLHCSQIDPSPNSVCSLQNTGAETFESSVWEYGFYVPNDQASLMKLYGGPEKFIRRLNTLHDGPSRGSSIGDIGNEPSFLTIFQYHYAGRPGLSAKRSHFYIPSRFSDTPGGVPGNDDSGAMGSLTAFNMMGIFPNPGQDVYFIIPPYFKAVSFKSPLGNNTATIRVDNFDPTYTSIYIQNATLNSSPYTKNWLTHDFFVNGGELVLTVGPRESTWGTRVEDVPPSLGEYPAFNWNITGFGSVMSVGASSPKAKSKGAEGHHVTKGGGGMTVEVRRRAFEAGPEIHKYWAAQYFSELDT